MGKFIQFGFVRFFIIPQFQFRKEEIIDKGFSVFTDRFSKVAAQSLCRLSTTGVSLVCGMSKELLIAGMNKLGRRLLKHGT